MEESMQSLSTSIAQVCYKQIKYNKQVNGILICILMYFNLFSYAFLKY